MSTFTQHRDREVRAVTLAITAVCAVGVGSAVIPGLEQAITAGLIGLGALALLVIALRLTFRWLRERREDRADDVAAAAWRAAHRCPTVPARGWGVA